jgi:Magnesium chelatase, subunit ChlI C-terminal
MDWRKFSGIWRTPRKSTLCGRSTREFFLLWSWRLKKRFKQTDLKRLRYNRVLKVSRTIADLSSTEEIQPSHALNYPTKDLNPFLRCSSHKRSWCRDRRSGRGASRSVQCPPARLCPLRRDYFRGLLGDPAALGVPVTVKTRPGFGCQVSAFGGRAPETRNLTPETRLNSSPAARRSPPVQFAGTYQKAGTEVCGNLD